MTQLQRLTMLVVASAVLVGMSATQVQAAEGKVLQIEGSTTVGPIAEAFAEAIMKADPEAKITVKKTGSGDGAAALVDGRCDMATMSRFMKPEEFKAAVEKGRMPVATVVAMDGVCMIVHPSNPVKELSMDQIKKIYTGEIKNWKDLGGTDSPVVIISRDTSSGTYETFNEKVMNKEKMSDAVEYVNSNPQVYNRVKETAGAIGYVGLGFVDAKVKAVKVEGVEPSRKTIASGVYPISRPLFVFTNGYPQLGTLLHQFVTYYLSEKGQEIVESKGLVPVTSY